jgi:hypothetical protein
MRQHPPGSDHRTLNLWQSEKIDDQFNQYHPHVAALMRATRLDRSCLGL